MQTLAGSFIYFDVFLLPLTVLFAQPRDELLRRDDAHLPLLVGDAVEQVGQAGEQVLFAPGLTPVGQDLLPKWPAEVQGLEHRVAVAGVSELRGENEMRVRRESATGRGNGKDGITSGLRLTLTSPK